MPFFNARLVGLTCTPITLSGSRVQLRAWNSIIYVNHSVYSELERFQWRSWPWVWEKANGDTVRRENITLHTIGENQHCSVMLMRCGEMPCCCHFGNREAFGKDEHCVAIKCTKISSSQNLVNSRTMWIAYYSYRFGGFVAKLYQNLWGKFLM